VTALIRSELRKVLTTNTWWLMLLGVVGFTVIALLVNVLVVASATLNGDPQSEQFGLVTMLISVPVGALYLSAHGVGSQLDQPTVLATLGLNLLAYAIWAVFGVGIGTLLRNQIAALVVCLVLKLVAEQAVGLVLTLLSDKLDQHWIMNLMWALPSQASTVMTTATRIPDAPVWYVGALILLAYGLVAGGLGSLITRRRDIT
jgi:hypothetical protein